jgi:hypothetical protein
MIVTSLTAEYKHLSLLGCCTFGSQSTKQTANRNCYEMLLGFLFTLLMRREGGGDILFRNVGKIF